MAEAQRVSTAWMSEIFCFSLLILKNCILSGLKDSDLIHNSEIVILPYWSLFQYSLYQLFYCTLNELYHKSKFKKASKKGAYLNVAV